MEAEVHPKLATSGLNSATVGTLLIPIGWTKSRTREGDGLLLVVEASTVDNPLLGFDFRAADDRSG